MIEINLTYCNIITAPCRGSSPLLQAQTWCRSRIDKVAELNRRAQMAQHSRECSREVTIEPKRPTHASQTGLDYGRCTMWPRKRNSVERQKKCRFWLAMWTTSKAQSKWFSNMTPTSHSRTWICNPNERPGKVPALALVIWSHLFWRRPKPTRTGKLILNFKMKANK